MVLPSGLIATLLTEAVCPLSVLLTSPEARSHTLVMWGGSGGEISHHHEADNKSTECEATHRMVLSHEDDTTALPSGLMATLVTPSVCPSSVLFTSPDARSHTLGRVGRFRREY